jgi:hypothetical protein
VCLFFGLLELKLQEKPLTLQKLNLFTFFLFDRYHNFFIFLTQFNLDLIRIRFQNPVHARKKIQKNVFLDLLDVLLFGVA